jgi:DnaJ-class molecular chaperone
MDFKDYYSTLGVAKTATDKEIKQAYRKLARKHHPDVNLGDKGAESRFKEINEAHEVLSDAVKRRKYDELGANWRAYEQAGPSAPGASSAQAWNVPFGAGGPGAHSMSEDEVREMFGDEHPFSDFFQTFFGGSVGPDEPRRRGGRAPRARAGGDVEHELELGLEDAARGSMHRLSLHHGGHARTVDVRIPPGVSDGSRVRVAGEGEQGSGGARNGDLFLRIRLATHGRFDRQGRDLYAKVPVPLTTAVLGGEVEVTTLVGKVLRLKIPPTTQQGQVFRLKGHGLPTSGKPAEPGDLYATADVQLPKTITAEQRTHFEALLKLETPDTSSRAGS